MQVLRLPDDFMDRYDFEQFHLLKERYLEDKDYWPARTIAAIKDGYLEERTDPTSLMRTTAKPDTTNQVTPALSPLAIAMMSRGIMPDKD